MAIEVLKDQNENYILADTACLLRVRVEGGPYNPRGMPKAPCVGEAIQRHFGASRRKMCFPLRGNLEKGARSLAINKPLVASLWLSFEVMAEDGRVTSKKRGRRRARSLLGWQVGWKGYSSDLRLCRKAAQHLLEMPRDTKNPFFSLFLS